MNFFGAVMVESEQILETLRINLLNYMLEMSQVIHHLVFPANFPMFGSGHATSQLIYRIVLILV